MSRLAKVISQVERGELVDLRRVELLLTLDVALADEAFAQEMASIRDQADEQLATTLRNR